jgi:hypothetical protein
MARVLTNGDTESHNDLSMPWQEHRKLRSSPSKPVSHPRRAGCR